MVTRLEIVNMPAKITNLDASHIIELYASGVGVTGIADMLGVSPSPVKRVLSEHGVALRGRSAQQQARMDRASPADRKALAMPANAARRGAKADFAELCNRAKGREGMLSQSSPLEDAFADAFDDSCVQYRRQVACGPYLCDFVIDSVAVEVWGGNYHFYGRHLARSAERFKYLLGVVKGAVIVTINRTNPLTPRLIGALIANCEEIGRQPTLTGEYRMIWCNGELITGNRLNGDDFAFKYPFRNGRDADSGRYKRVP